jgi:large-conductance mechanosensitive channel
MNRLTRSKTEQEETPEEPSDDVVLLREIRDLLRTRDVN